MVLLAKTTHNYAKKKQIVIADLLSFIKRRDREVPGVTRKGIILQRNVVALHRTETAICEQFKLTEVELMFAKYYTLLRLAGKGGKFVPILIPPKTLEVVDLMINGDKLKSDNNVFQTEGRRSILQMFWGNPLRSLSSKTNKGSDLQSSTSSKHFATAPQFLNLPPW